MKRMFRFEQGFTLLELMIVVVILGILAAIAIPIYQAQSCKARLAEVVKAMNHLSGAVGDYYGDNETWPPLLNSAAAIKNTLNVGLAVGGNNRIEGVTINNGQITCDIQNCCSEVDSGSLILIPTVNTNGSVVWRWDKINIPPPYVPKK